MNREIKFRIWTKNERTGQIYMTEPFALDKDFDCLCGCFDGVIMQYTGLKDKNGKEIYEGDIVKIVCEWGCSLHKIVFRQYDDDEMHTTNIHVGWYALTIMTDYIHKGAIANDRTLSDIHSSCEVIGNIYEKPELT